MLVPRVLPLSKFPGTWEDCLHVFYLLGLAGVEHALFTIFNNELLHSARYVLDVQNRIISCRLSSVDGFLYTNEIHGIAEYVY